MTYRTIVVDPPWPMPTGGPRAGTRVWNPGTPSALPYEPMMLSEIHALPVGDLAAGSAHLYVWTVNAYVEETYRLMRESWGFRPSQLLVWAKTPRGLGMGGAFTNTTEFVLFGWRGSCNPIQRMDSSWWNWRRGKHSAKPEAFLDMVESVSPGPYLELFARRQRLGWDTYGDEALQHVEFDRRPPPDASPFHFDPANIVASR